MVHYTEDRISEEMLEKKAETLKTIAHPMRLQIINILMNGELRVGDIVKRLGAKQSLTSQQLSILKLHGVIKSRRNGHAIFYFLENKSIKNVMASILAEK